MPTKIGVETSRRRTESTGAPQHVTVACTGEVSGQPVAAVAAEAGRGTAGHRFCSAVCFHTWHQRCRDEVARDLDRVGPRPKVAPEIAAALATIERDDPEELKAAARAVEWLTLRGPQRLTQLALCEFLWYELPGAVDSVAQGRHVAGVLGRLLEALDLSRYAGLCTAQVTTEIVRTAVERGVPAAREEFQRAMYRSGIVPPDIPELAWGTVMGVEELEAYEATAAMLELAVTAGRLRSGSVGWRARQAEIAGEYLRSADPALGGVSRLDRIRAERISTWARSRGTARGRAVAGLTGRIRDPQTVPSDADEHLAPPRWLLERAGTDGLPLTDTHALAGSVVAEAQEWFGLDGTGICLGSLHELLLAMKALRRNGKRLVITSIGRQLLAHPERLWAAVAGGLVGDGEGPAEAAAEGALVVLAEGRQLGREELARRVGAMLAGEGWRDPATGGTPDASSVRTALRGLWIRLSALGLLADERWLRPLRLSTIGQAAVLAALQARAVRPRHTLAAG
ncbi:MAG TPA: hypothetical protein VGS19_04385 [Streptosporangiaceae bacterium]|nr:hypothetical protein [Streptosporangiaceae bacterium]